jgi:hypothetical protein
VQVWQWSGCWLSEHKSIESTDNSTHVHKHSRRQSSPEWGDVEGWQWSRCWLARLPDIQLLTLAAHHHADLARGVGGDGGVRVTHAAASKHLHRAAAVHNSAQQFIQSLHQGALLGTGSAATGSQKVLSAVGTMGMNGAHTATSTPHPRKTALSGSSASDHPRDRLLLYSTLSHVSPACTCLRVTG